MRFTPSANWNTVAASSNRIVTWTVSIKKTTTLNAALSAGTWLDVTTYLTELPAIQQRIEYELGQFSSDSISFTAKNIDWWEANVFNATEAQYLELKITATLSSPLTTDVFYAFSGFIDKVGVQYDELNDTVSFDVFTADELGNRISILNVNTQYFNTSVDGSGTDGLILPRMTGIFVTSSAVASYNLKVGLHSIEYVNATSQIRLDDGDYTTLSGANQSVTLANLAADQKITLYIQAASVPVSEESITDYVIVETEGTVLPQQPHYGLSIGQFLKKLNAEVGIDTTTLDTLKIASHDSTKRISYYDIPPENIAITGARYGICFDGTDIWVGVGNKLYKRQSSDESYTLMGTLTAGFGIGKLLYNSRNNQIWIMSSSDGAFSTDEFDRINAFDIGTDTVTNTISTTLRGSFPSAHIIDYNYTGSSYKYALVYIDAPNVKEVTISVTTLSLATVYTATGGWGSDSNGVGFIKGGNKYIWQETDGATGKLHQFSVSAAGAWVDDSYLLNNHANLATIFNGAYNVTDDKLYYSGIGGSLYSVPVNSATAPTEITGYSIQGANAFVSDGSTYVYFSENRNLYHISANTVTSVDTSIASSYGGLTYSGSTLYGLDYEGRIFQWSATIVLYTKKYAYDDDSLNSIRTQLLTSFNLTQTLSSHKKAFVYRRGNDSGTIQTTGNNITLTTANVSQIQKIANEYAKMLLVTVANSDESHCYNGTAFDSKILSDKISLEISNDLIPTNIVKDLAKWIFTFYNTAHDKYIFSVDVPKMEYEVMDGADVTFTSTKIAIDSTGLITGQSINNDGTMELEVIF